jgi:LysM repeat protein
MPLTTLRANSCHLLICSARSKFEGLIRAVWRGKKRLGQLTMFCQIPPIPHDWRMKLVFLIPAASALTLFLSSCGNNGGGSSGGPQVSTGPFDSSGRYREDWADDPSKWRKTGGTPSPHEMGTDELPQIAKNDEPPPNSNPLPPTRASSSVPVIAQSKVVSKPKPSGKTEEVVVRTKPTTDGVAQVTARTKSTAKKSPQKSTSQSKRTAAKPKTTKTVAKAKPKPKATRYVVKKGDSLSAIASRTGSSVAAIKSENGISGTLIRPGQSLKIPKK